MQHLLSSKTMFFLVQFISTQNVQLQHIGTDLTQTGSTTPSIISGIVLFIGYNIVNTMNITSTIHLLVIMSELITKNLTEPFKW